MSTLLALVLACAPYVAPLTTLQVIHNESRGDPLAIHVNRLRVQPPPPASIEEAAQLASDYVRRGYSVDVGLMQVNSANLAALGYRSMEQAFDVCANIQGGTAILTADYLRAVGRFGPGLPALLAALSAYNTGSFSRGFANGYVAQYLPSGNAPRAPIVDVADLPDLPRHPAAARPRPAPTVLVARAAAVPRPAAAVQVVSNSPASPYRAVFFHQ